MNSLTVGTNAGVRLKEATPPAEGDLQQQLDDAIERSRKLGERLRDAAMRVDGVVRHEENEKAAAVGVATAQSLRYTTRDRIDRLNSSMSENEHLLDQLLQFA